FAMALSGAARAFWMPTSQAMTPNLVPPEAFQNAVAMNSMLLQIGVIAGPSLGGVLYLLGPAVVYGTSLALLLIILLLISMIRPFRAAAPAKAFSASDLLEGIRFVLHKRAVLGATALLPIYASDVLHIGPAGLGVLRTAPGVGAALTAMLLAFNPIESHAGRWMFGGVAAFGAATVVFGVSQAFWVSLPALAVLGAGDMLSVYIRHVLVQLETPDEIRGR